MEGHACPLCGGRMEEIDMSDEYALTKRAYRGPLCRSCALSATAPFERFDALWGRLARGDAMTVQSVQRANPTGEVGEDGQPVVQRQAVGTTDGIVMEHPVNIDKVAERWPGKSPLGLLEDALLHAVLEDALLLAVEERPSDD